MLFFYRNLPVSTKLLLSNLAFALPMVVLIFFMNISFTYDINIGQQELAGTKVLRPLFSLLDQLPQHTLANEGKKAAEQEKILALFTLLQQSRSKAKTSRQREDTPLTSRTGDPPANPWGLQEQWLSLQQGDTGRAEYAKLQARIVELFSLTGKDFLLSLDPAMDSKLLAGLLVGQLPRNFGQLNTYCFLTATANRQATPAAAIEVVGHPAQEQQHAFSLFQADFEHIIADARLALAEDANYYGTSPSLHGSFAQVLDDYQKAMAQFMPLHQQRTTQPVEIAAYSVASNKARQSCQQLFLARVEELDILINKRIASYRKWQVLAFAGSALALLFASMRKILRLSEALLAWPTILKKKVIVEGIEAEAQLALAPNLGCEFGQGYLLAKPLPADEAEQLLRLAAPFF